MNARISAGVYLDVKAAVLAAGYDSEIEWQEARTARDVTEKDILREAAWVILSAGLSVKAVESVFTEVSRAYCEWDLDELLSADLADVERRALSRFGNEGKIRAITAFCLNLRQIGRDALVQALEGEGAPYLAGFDFLGPATSHHLAKNLGVQVAKPDRHLTRIAAKLGWEEPQAMCEAVATLTGDTVAVVDIVFWRFAASEPNYLDIIDKSIHRWVSEAQLPNSRGLNVTG